LRPWPGHTFFSSFAVLSLVGAFIVTVPSSSSALLSSYQAVP
jgi:hypothetical protein